MSISNTKERTNSSGFTILELLVAIAIIGLLAAVVLVSVGSARENSRDARRMADLKQLQLAVELYIQQNQEIPCPSITEESQQIIDGPSNCLNGVLVPNYLPALPVDPQNGGDGSFDWGLDYQYYATAEAYAIRTALEGEPVGQNATYPDGATCQGGSLPVCPWVG